MSQQRQNNYVEVPKNLLESENFVRIASYNITAVFFDPKGDNQDHHKWINRKDQVINHIKMFNPSILGCQELTAEQVLDMLKGLPEYSSVCYAQSPSEIQVGEIVTDNEIEKWVGKFAGTAPIGFFFKKNEFNLISTGMQWFNENPKKIPEFADRGQTDKGFGNTNTYRAVAWAKFLHIKSGRMLFTFNSHYPLSGDNKTRMRCASLEREIISEVAGNDIYYSVGDRNIIPTPTDTSETNPESVYSTLVGDSYDSRSPGSEGFYGSFTTFIGFMYDRCNVKLSDPNSKFAGVLDVIFSNQKALGYVSSPGCFDEETKEMIPLEKYPENMDKIDNGRQACASDHCLCLGIYSLE